MRLLVGHDQAVAEWIGNKIGHQVGTPYTAMGWIDGDGKLRVGFAFYNFEPGGNIDLAVASTAGLTRGIIRSVSHYVFRQLPARRATARPPMKHARACSVLKRIGFVQEAICKHYYEHDDAVQFRLLMNDAKRWLDVQPTSTDPA